MDNIPTVEIYSDGGATPNPGKGGFGVILKHKNHEKEFYQGFKLTTNNRMELMGVIIGLEQLKKRSKVTVYTDSKLVVDGINLGWAENWKKNSWTRNSTEPALNSDLWAKLLDLLEKHIVRFIWIKGHSGHPENERCDQLVKKAIQSNNLSVDEGYFPRNE